MNLEQMECIVEIAKTGSLSKAANHLNVTRSAVSQSITNLETELGIKLFVRSHAGAIPTPDGEVIIEKARIITQQVEGIKAEAAQRAAAPLQVLRIASTPEQLALLTDTYISFKEDYPNTHLPFMESSVEQIFDDLEHDRVDVGLMILHDRLLKDKPHLQTKPLVKTKLMLSVSKTSPLAALTSISIEDLLNVPLVFYKDDILTKLFADDVAENYRPLNVMLTSDNIGALRVMLVKNYAASITTELTFQRHPNYTENYACIEIDYPGWNELHVGWVSMKDKNLPERTALFLERLEQDLKAYYQ
ncbi:DNA-binding transcriptional LysR family regulator [Paenibacillus taihuensis]|uniref:DNA-binding transcriptional LysR family regulator n=1 Tax=Paenibacillus taihuensis TaxID=1156355 RepID=A0A3D9RQD4_9BACL|nr:LysR family transcriptional regulator [Paenibacillus taihuensis]REE78953.1 DNA-binding transcriptional LysR family regulator [Paenibacillus taihuensis]